MLKIPTKIPTDQYSTNMITPTARGLEELYVKNLRCFIFQTGRQTGRQTETLILIPMFKIYVFSYSRRTDREINPVWAG